MDMGKSRNEEILENILGEQDPLESPRSRNEQLLHLIYEMLQDGAQLEATYEDGKVTLTVG